MVSHFEDVKLIDVPNTPSLFAIASELDGPLRDYVQAASPFSIPQGFWFDFPHHHLLFYGLGKLESQDEMAARRVAALYAGKELNILWNASGTGKSRLAIEGLTSRWGIYLACHNVPNCASSDLHIIMSNLQRERFSTSGNYTKSPSPVSRMQAHIEQMLKRLLCSRLIVFARFLVYANEAGNSRGHSYQLKWLLLQLLPFDIFSRDIFVAQFRDLCEQPDTIVEDLLSTAWNIVKERLGPGEDLYLVVDDAQDIKPLLPNVFSWQDGTWYEPHSLLEGVRAWFPDILRGHWKTILVGTSLDFAPHPFEEPVIHSTSAFVGPEQHLRYISDILWPDTPLEEVVSTRGALLHRLFSWLRGRHSITSSFVEICEGYRNEDIGELLDAFIYNSIHHYARSHDIIDRPIHQKPFLPRWFMDIVLHDDEQYRGLLRVFFNIILHGTSPISLEKAYELVGCGLFRFTDSTPPEAILDEPFAICWLAQMLVRKSPGTLSALRDQVNLCFERGAEEYTPSADARADIRDYFLEDEERLETLFEALWNTLELRDEAEMLFPEWANEKLYEGMRTTLPRRRQRSSARSRKQKRKKKKGRRSYVVFSAADEAT